MVYVIIGFVAIYFAQVYPWAWLLLILDLFLPLIVLLIERKIQKNDEDSVLTLSSSIDAMDGHTFEYWCAELLRQNGFTDVSVTPGSNDQGIDVLAYKDGLKYGVQCKCYSNDLGNKPVQEATAGRAVYGCDIAVVMTNRHFTKGAVEAAKATGVWLWDRDKLAQMVIDAKQNSGQVAR